MERCDYINENSTLDEIIRYYLDNHVKSFYAESTYKSYKSKMDKYVLPYIGSYEVSQLKKRDVQDLIYTLISEEKALATNSIRQVHSILHKILNFALDMELVDKNASTGVKLPAQVKYDLRIYSKTEVKRLLDKAKDSFLYIPISLAVRSGLRRSEILALQWQDFNANDGTLIIKKGISGNNRKAFSGTKSRRSVRVLKIPSPLWADLIKHKEEQCKLLKGVGHVQTAETLIVCKGNGDSYNPTFISRKFSELLAANGLPAMKFHGCRHTYSTHAHNSGMPIKHLSRSLGHSTAAITVENYVHINDNYTL